MGGADNDYCGTHRGDSAPIPREREDIINLRSIRRVAVA